MTYDFLHRVRLYELERALPYLPIGGRLLEIGAGAGWQLEVLAARGYEVSGIDIETSQYLAVKVREIIEYDGRRIPFEDGTFDIVFSSNVLEHIPRVEEFQREIYRVLKTDGIAVHVLPTATWRLWANMSHYLLLPKRIADGLSHKPHTREHQKINDGRANNATKHSSRNILSKVFRLLYPPRHGEIGNCITEMYWFSRFRWQRLFEGTGWQIRARCASQLCNFPLLQHRRPSIGVDVMHKLSYFMGSSCLIYVLAKAGLPRVQEEGRGTPERATAGDGGDR